LYLLAAMFQSPLFDSNQQDYLNYGSVGYIIGHELIHSIDNIGKNYDALGKKTNWVSIIS